MFVTRRVDFAARVRSFFAAVLIFTCAPALPTMAVPGDDGPCWTWDGIDVPCTSGEMKWNYPNQCYGVRMKDPPEFVEAAFKSSESRRLGTAAAMYQPVRVVSVPVAAPGEVEMYAPDYAGGQEPGHWETCGGYAAMLNNANINQWWVYDGIGAQVDPVVLARRAVEDMGIRAPQVGMTGGDPPDGMQIIGIPAWMWLTDPGEQTTGPVTRSVSEGGVSVTATGRLDRTVWSMGDGAVVTCDGSAAPYVPYDAGYWDAPSPVCGHTYTRTSAGQPGQAYTVTVTAYWTVSWSSGDGQSGTIPVSVSRSVLKQVGQVQVLNTGPDGGS